MHRRGLALPSLLMAAAIAVSACGPSTPTIDDPAEILAKAVEALQGLKTVHLEAGVDGTINFDLTGTGGGNLSLAGTKLTADVDLPNSKLAATLEVPAMLGMTADVIVVDGETFTRTSLSGDKYAKAAAGDMGLGVPTDPVASLGELKGWLARPEIGPEKLGDTSCGSKSCYQVKIDLSTADLAALVPGGAADLGDAQVILTVLVERDTLRPASFVVKAGSVRPWRGDPDADALQVGRERLDRGAAARPGPIGEPRALLEPSATRCADRAHTGRSEAPGDPGMRAGPTMVA